MSREAAKARIKVAMEAGVKFRYLKEGKMLKLNNIKNRKPGCLGALILVGLLFFTGVAFAQQRTQIQVVFKSPEEAMKMLFEVVQADDLQKEMNIFGPEGENIISSGDEVADKLNHAKFMKSYKEKVAFVKDGGRVSVILGKDNWPMAIPIVKKEDGWVFDTKAGLQELLKRRIGRNELMAIKTVQAYVQAQREYASVGRTLDGIMQYAQKFCSTPGKRDGLYWETAGGEASSPLGLLFAAAADEGYKSGQMCFIIPIPYHGYIYKILTAQGEDAPGGAYNYVINGHMVAGFALMAWPSEYGVSGIMTFIANQNDVVYEKDLGPNTGGIAKAIRVYNPDQSWSRAE